MITRRDSLRLLSLTALALAAAPALAACGDPMHGEGGSLDSTPDGLQLVSSDVARAPGSTSAIPRVVGAVDTLGGGLFGQAPDTGNLALSPFSVATALAMTLNGAVGTTQRQLRRVLGDLPVGPLNAGLDALTARLDALAGPVQNDSGTKTELALSSADGLFGQQGEDWQQPFLDTLATYYGAGMQAVDFEHDTETARAAVNSWTAQRTADRITEILPPDAVDADTRLVLVNALYLKAPWATAFDPDLTADGSFATPDGAVQVPMMHTTADDGTADAYGRGHGWQAVRLPYAGHELAMTVIVPDQGGFGAVAADVVAHGTAAYLEACRPAAVELTLPTWTFRTAVSLSEALQALGVTDAFDPDAADLSGMTTQDSLFLSDVLHQVFVAVDEQGTEAAAATAVVAEATAAQRPDATLVVDRPFLFVVHDLAHHTPLFLGRVADPTAS